MFSHAKSPRGTAILAVRRTGFQPVFCQPPVNAVLRLNTYYRQDRKISYPAKHILGRGGEIFGQKQPTLLQLGRLSLMRQGPHIFAELIRSSRFVRYGLLSSSQWEKVMAASLKSTMQSPLTSPAIMWAQGSLPKYDLLASAVPP